MDNVNRQMLDDVGAARERADLLPLSTQWAEARGWSRMYQGFPERVELLMQVFAGFHGAVEWHKDGIERALRPRFGEEVNVLEAVKVAIAALDVLCPEWRTEEASRPVGFTPATTDFIDALLVPKGLSPSEIEQLELEEGRETSA